MAQISVTINASNAVICLGSSTTLQAVTAGTGPFNYTWTPSSNLNNTNSEIVIASPIETITYTVTVENTVTNETGNASITITVNSNSSSITLAGVQGAGAICNQQLISTVNNYFRDGNCNSISKVTPSGSMPVSGVVMACVKVDTGANKMGSLDMYVARRYDIEPVDNPESSTATVTLYYLQSEFDNFNSKSLDSGLFPLPTGPDDLDGINNMIIRQFHGTGIVPGNYSGSRQNFYSTTSGVNINWNGSANRWEIEVPVSGFSGFYITSKKGSFLVLPVKLEYFKGAISSNKNKLSWKVNCTSDKVEFEVQRSTNGQDYTTISVINADRLRCNSPFEFTDEDAIPGINYYRLHIIDETGTAEYSNTVLLKNKKSNLELLELNPNLVYNNAVLKIRARTKTEIILVIKSLSGAAHFHQTIKLRDGTNNIPINTATLLPGGYIITVHIPGEDQQSIQFIKL